MGSCLKLLDVAIQFMLNSTVDILILLETSLKQELFMKHMGQKNTGIPAPNRSLLPLNGGRGRRPKGGGTTLKPLTNGHELRTPLIAHPCHLRSRNNRNIRHLQLRGVQTRRVALWDSVGCDSLTFLFCKATSTTDLDLAI